MTILNDQDDIMQMNKSRTPGLLEDVVIFHSEECIARVTSTYPQKSAASLLPEGHARQPMSREGRRSQSSQIFSFFFLVDSGSRLVKNRDRRGLEVLVVGPLTPEEPHLNLRSIFLLRSS